MSDNELRPQLLDDYQGQPDLVKNLRIEVAAAKRRDEPLEHVLLHGPPGLGKTTLALILANEMGAHCHITTGPVMKKPTDLQAALFKLNEKDILFIDEIHRLPMVTEEVLYSAMEDFAIDAIIGTASMHLKLPRFTLVGATTRHSMLSAPLRDRFMSVYRLEYYDTATLVGIAKRTAGVFKIAIDDTAAFEIAQRGRGTPRIVNRLVRRCRNVADVEGTGITYELTARTMRELGIDQHGLDGIDRAILTALVKDFHGGPVGLETLAAAAMEEPDTVMDVHEPFLIQHGFLMRTSRGRQITDKGRALVAA